MAAVFLCAASLGSAEPVPPGQFRTYGAGTQSCGTWLADRRETNQLRWHYDGEWVLGWVSAAGYYNVQRNLRETDADAVTTWIDKYCREHSLNHLYEAAASLVGELSKPR